MPKLLDAQGKLYELVEIKAQKTENDTGKIVETPKVDFWRFRDGKAVEFYEYYDTARVIGRS